MIIIIIIIIIIITTNLITRESSKYFVEAPSTSANPATAVKLVLFPE
jgi:hypothetical protein